MPGLVTSVHHRNEMLCTVQALLVTLTGFWDEVIAAVECTFRRSLCIPACAASVFMAGCKSAPHPAMSERTSPESLILAEKRLPQRARLFKVPEGDLPHYITMRDHGRTERHHDR